MSQDNVRERVERREEMSPESVWDRFQKEFPDMVPQVTRWFRRHTDTAAASIRIMLRNHRTLIFSINRDGTWILRHGGSR